jgi:sigma-B regulation protein RsbU (phosphoserine phosphatase)
MGRKLNSFIYESSTDNKFITCFIGILNPATGELEVLNAGHEPPIIRRHDGTIEEIGSGGLPLGIFDDTPPLECQWLRLDAGDTLLVYTDGITDALNEAGEDYSKARIKDLLRQPDAMKAPELIRRVREEVLRFTGDAPLTDDVTVLAVTCTLPAPSSAGDLYVI